MKIKQKTAAGLLAAFIMTACIGHQAVVKVSAQVIKAPKIITARGYLPCFLDGKGQKIYFTGFEDVNLYVIQNSRVNLSALLPKTILVHPQAYERDAPYYLPVEWTIKPVDTKKVQTIFIKGRIKGTSYGVRANLYVQGLITSKDIDSISPDRFQISNNDTRFKLPEILSLNRKTHITEERKVKWNVPNVDLKKIGQQIIYGTIDGCSQKAKMTVNVVPQIIRKDVSEFMLPDNNGTLQFSPVGFMNEAGISVQNAPIVYNSDYTFQQHMENLAKLFDFYGGTLHLGGGFWSSDERNTREGTDNGLGKIVQAAEDRYDGKYTGKTVIISDYWRRSSADWGRQNIDYNLFLATYKYFLGDKAGEDLWGFIDNAYVTGKYEPQKYNFTSVNKGKSKNYAWAGNYRYPELAKYTAYELTHANGAKVMFLDSPDGQNSSEVIILARGKE